jgi:hypothetical protein
MSLIVDRIDGTGAVICNLQEFGGAEEEMVNARAELAERRAQPHQTSAIAPSFEAEKLSKALCKAGI